MKNRKKILELLTSDFERRLFDSALKNLNDSSNELRYNNFAYSIRELSRHFLCSLSPETEVFACKWFKSETENGKPTRAQRIKYAIQGGFSDEVLTKLGFDISIITKIITKVTRAINSLSKYTHINEGSYDLDKKEITKQSEIVLQSFSDLVNIIRESKLELSKFLDGRIDNDVLDTVISNDYENISMLAPHFQIEYHFLNSSTISKITSKEVIVGVNGFISVKLEYGSKQERREGDGLDLADSFPFNSKVTYKLTDEFPNTSCEADEFDVDTSSWYGPEEE